MANTINKVSNETREKIRKKSVLNLPNKIIGNPELVKQAFTGLVIDSNNSVLGELNRIVEEANDGFLSKDTSDLVLTGTFGNEDEIIIRQNEQTKKIKGDDFKKEIINEIVDNTIIEDNVREAIEQELEHVIEEKEQEYAPRLLNVENNKADKAALAAVASGSPKGVFPTLLDLENEYPDGTEGIYVVTDDGHWYYWNESAWTDGGEYLVPKLEAENIDYGDSSVKEALNNLYVEKTRRYIYVNLNGTKSIKEVIENNLIPNGDFATGASDWSKFRGTASTVNGVVELVGNNNTDGYMSIYKDVAANTSDKYYVFGFLMTPDTVTNFRVTGDIANPNIVTSPTPNRWYCVSMLAQIVNSRGRHQFSLHNGTIIGTKLYVKNTGRINVTALRTEQQYSTLFDDTFDNLTDQQVKEQLDKWLNEYYNNIEELPYLFNSVEKLDNRIYAVEQYTEETLNGLKDGTEINDGAITPEKTNFIIKPVILNRFDPSSPVETNKIIHKNGTISSATGYYLTDFIPVLKNETLIIPYIASVLNNFVICLFESDKETVVNQDATIIDSEDNIYRSITIPSYDNIKYARFTVSSSVTFKVISGTDTMPEEEIPYNYNSYYLNSNIKISNLPDNILNGKTIGCCGDSIMESRLSGGSPNGGAWPKIIGEKNNMVVTNLGKSGSTIAQYYNSSILDKTRSIYWQLTNLQSPLDYIIFDGGVNDFAGGGDGTSTLGIITSGYSSDIGDYDLDTLLGGLEAICATLVFEHTESKYGWVFNHKIYDDDHEKEGFGTWIELKEAMKSVFKKWGVPYLDLEDIVPPLNKISALKSIYTNNGDGWHPNEDGYRVFYCDKIETWLKTLGGGSYSNWNELDLSKKYVQKPDVVDDDELKVMRNGEWVNLLDYIQDGDEVDY
jgi:lysophospholipase L1-like esterase